MSVYAAAQSPPAAGQWLAAGGEETQLYTKEIQIKVLAFSCLRKYSLRSEITIGDFVLT
jgi:hypothetical protein